MNAAAPAHPHRETRRGFAFGVAAYGLWGVLPIYFKAIAAVAAVDIVAHRILWSLPFLALLLFVSRGWSEVRQAVRRRRTLLLLLSTATLIGINWLLYVYAVTSGHILAASLGYYLNPLANVLLGRTILKERLSWLQWIAIAIAAAGILALAVGALGQLWISLTLCVTFATYGLLRKIALVDAVAGLGIETALAVPAGDRLAGLALRDRRSDSRHHGKRYRAAGRRRSGFDDAAAAVHRGRAAPALFDARDAPVPRPDAAIPVRGVALWRAVRPRPCDRLRCDLGGAGAVHVRIDPRAACLPAAATAGMTEPQRAVPHC